MYAVIDTWARTRYQNTTDRDASVYGDKVRELIERHVTVLGVQQVIPPSRITAADFTTKVEALPGPERADFHDGARHPPPHRGALR